eukprot:IDg4457t1
MRVGLCSASISTCCARSLSATFPGMHTCVCVAAFTLTGRQPVSDDLAAIRAMACVNSARRSGKEAPPIPRCSVLDLTVFCIFRECAVGAQRYKTKA